MNNISKEIKVLAVSALALTGLFFSSIVFGAGLPQFGGKNIAVVKCTCPGDTGSQVIIANTGRNAKFNGIYLYLPGTTKVKGKSKVISGRNIIGKYSPGGICKMQAGETCTLVPAKGTMTLIRTN